MNRQKIRSLTVFAAAGLVSALLFLPTIPVLAQVQTAWIARYNVPGNEYDEATALAVDDSGNVYVTGSSGGDYATIKYAPYGDTVWVRRYPGAGIALAVDGSGYVYVTGSSGGDYATIKYAANGDTLWVRRYPGYANALTVDGSGNVYVTGQSFSSATGYDYATIKYAPNGDTLWVRRYNGPGSQQDNACDLVVDDNGNVYVTGFSGSYPDLDYVTIKYTPNGDTLWVRPYRGPSNSFDKACDLAVDGSDNVYVAGSANGDYATIKYTPNGDTLWVRRYNGPNNSYDRATALVVDESSNVYVTGVSFGGCFFGGCAGAEYATIKYAPNGDSLWVRRFGESSENQASALTVDGSGNVYVTGAGGHIQCSDYDGPPSCGFAGDYYSTIKYAPIGDSLWAERYDGPANGSDFASALAVDDSGNVYVTGASFDSTTGFDYATIKYSPFVATKGDMDGDGNLTTADVMLMLNCVFLGTGNCAHSFTDVNCSGSLSPADIVLELNAVFLQSPFPCS